MDIFPSIRAIVSIAVSTLTTLAALLPAAKSSNAQPLVQLLPSATASDAEFGYVVDIDGGVAIVGAQRDDDQLELDRGSAFVFRWDGAGWVEEAKLGSAMTAAFNYFGSAVAVSGDVVAITETNGDMPSTNAGNVYVFRYAGGAWTQEAVLTPPDEAIGDDFGGSLDLEGDRLIIGAPVADDAVGDQGIVYTYTYANGQWNQSGRLVASDPGLQDLFGSAVSLDGDRLLIGAFNADDSTSSQAGKVYVFDYDGSAWNETAILQADESSNIANMGVSVSLDGEWAVSGAPNSNRLRGGAGTVYVHRFDGATWNFHSFLHASDGDGFYLFGSSVAVEDTVLAVGAENWAPPGLDSTGKVYILRYDAALDQWVEAEGLVPDGAERGAHVGESVALEGGVLLFGATDFGESGGAWVRGEPQTTTSAEVETPTGGFSVSAAYPNPFSGVSALTVSSDRPATVKVTLHDVLGRQVQTVFEGRAAASSPTTIRISARNVPSGLYWVRVESDHGVVTRAVTVIR